MEEAIIISLITNAVEVLNLANKFDGKNVDFISTRKSEIKGMLICLKNITKSDKMYAFEYVENKYQFGYYLDNEYTLLAE